MSLHLNLTFFGFGCSLRTVHPRISSTSVRSCYNFSFSPSTTIFPSLPDARRCLVFVEGSLLQSRMNTSEEKSDSSFLRLVRLVATGRGRDACIACLKAGISVPAAEPRHG